MSPVGRRPGWPTASWWTAPGAKGQVADDFGSRRPGGRQPVGRRLCGPAAKWPTTLGAGGHVADGSRGRRLGGRRFWEPTACEGQLGVQVAQETPVLGPLG